MLDDEVDYDDDHFDFLEAGKMDVSVILYIAGAVLIFSLLLGCCCRSKRKGRILSPPPVEVTVSNTPAPYPQQQYTIPAQYPTPVVVTAYPAQNASMPYPSGAPYPAAAPYPAVAPYPTAGAPYPNAGAPYPQAGAPYPQAGAPYPSAGAPYPTAPSAPDDNNVFYALSPPGWKPVAGNGYQALPPPYEQAMKQSPYNPSVPR